jgi:hypothetical protein
VLLPVVACALLAAMMLTARSGWGGCGLLASPCAAHAPSLAIRDLDDGGRIIHALSLGSSERFILRFTHSMYGGAVLETYAIAGNPGPTLERSIIRTDSGGAAEYYAYYGNFRRDGRGWIVEAPPLRLSSVMIRVDLTGDPAIHLDDQVVRLLDLVPDGHLVELRPG